jgi:hypothetical protein
MRASAVLAVLGGLILRLFFVLKFPATDSGDAPFYIELAWNWLRNGVYGFPIAGRLTPVDMRVPGYPAFLAAVFSFFGRATRPVMLVQVGVDLATCVLVALIAARLAPSSSRERAGLAGLWLTALCPFTANYTAVVLTETLVTFLTALAILVLLGTDLGAANGLSESPGYDVRWTQWVLGGIVVGFGTLVRPETPLLFQAVGFMLVVKWWRPVDWRKLLRAVVLLSSGLFLTLLPWAVRNWQTFREVQFLAPHYSELPGEFAPLGFDDWINTWLWRFRDVYLVTWKLDVEPISIGDLPASAFDSAQERNRVAGILDQYNTTLTWTRRQDSVLALIARERTERHILRTYVRIPLLRCLTMWFTPRVELLPISGKLWPLREKWQDDRGDFLATLGLALTNYFYVVLALAGVWICRRQPSCMFLLLFILVRTVYLTTLADEAPEPRYVLECFPAILALGAQVFRGKSQLSSTGSG